MSKLTQAGDVLAQHSVSAICSYLNELESKKQEDIPIEMQKILTCALNKTVIISPRGLNRRFPQLYTEESRLHINYFIGKNSKHKSNWKSISLQISVAAVLACCSEKFVDEEISVDETFCTFSQKWPYLANFANQIHNLITSKAIPNEASPVNATNT